MKCGFCVDCDKPCFNDRCEICLLKFKKKQERIALHGLNERIKEGECYLWYDKLSEKLKEQGRTYCNNIRQ